MKATTKVIHEKSEYTCDECGKKIEFSPIVCYGCGKHACSFIHNWKHFDTEYPKWRGSYYGQGVPTPRVSFCQSCYYINDGNDPLVNSFKQIEAERYRAETILSRHIDRHNRLAARIGNIAEERRQKFDGDRF